jgi:hypothetical protein
MQRYSTDSSANTDSEARRALWMAICDAASKLVGHCTVYLSRSPDREMRIVPKMPVPDVQTWQLVEALSLLAILLKADKVNCGDVTNIFGKTGPLHFVEDTQDRYLWAQPTLSGQESGLGGRPDLVVASTQDKPTALTTLRVIECKCRKHLGTPDIRAEFGKAHDLRVASYLIWSFTTPSPRVVEGAKRLGLDVEVLGFDTTRRADLIARPEILVSHVANTLEVSRRGKRFAQALIESGQDASGKMLEVK